jgi:hypothetical protein
MKHTRSHRVPEHARSVGEHAGVRRAPCDEDACAKLGGAAGRRHRQRRRAPCSELWGDGAVSGERGGESTRGDEDAGAHARHMRRRTPLRQLTFPPRPISRVSSASLPFLAASYTASPIAALELPEPICSARWWRRVLWRRERVGRRVFLTRNRRKSQDPEAPKVRSMTSSTRALRGTGRALELAVLSRPSTRACGPGPFRDLLGFLVLGFLVKKTGNRIFSRMWIVGVNPTPLHEVQYRYMYPDTSLFGNLCVYFLA